MTELKLEPNADLRGADLAGRDMSGAKLGRANLEYAKLEYANLEGADLEGANLFGAILRDADLRGAKLRGANLKNADLKNAKFDPAPKVQDLAARILAEVEKDPSALNMTDWHCGTMHCLAGWSIHYAGEEGAKLEASHGAAAAGVLIWLASEKVVPDFYADDVAALRWLRDYVSGEARP